MKVTAFSLFALLLGGLLLLSGVVQAQNPSPTLPPTATPRSVPSATPTYPPEPPGCLQPPEDYSRVNFNGSILNQRTVFMLQHAQALYGGPIDLLGRGLTQGSYNAGGVALSFGTHDGGGAVDISVRNVPVDWSIRWDDIPVMLQALRTAGFAAWYRDEANDMTPHIHAIAIGDAELSPAARLQLDGRYGYFRGFDGLPQPDGVPNPDGGEDIVLCHWMRDLGFEDMRGDLHYPSPPYSYSPGTQVQVNTQWGQRLNLRAGPSTSTQILEQLSAETTLILLGGPEQAEGYQWWQLGLPNGLSGWGVDNIDGATVLVPVPLPAEEAQP